MPAATEGDVLNDRRGMKLSLSSIVLRITLLVALVTALCAVGSKVPHLASAALNCTAERDNIVPNCGFETPSVGASGFMYTPSGATWTFDGGPGATSSGGSGITANNSPFTQLNPPAPQGSQAAFLQGRSAMTQTVQNMQAYQVYALTFALAQRANQPDHTRQQDIQVYFDNQLLGGFTAQSTNYVEQGPLEFFTARSGRHRLIFRGLNSQGGDNTALIDNVILTRRHTHSTPAPRPTPIPRPTPAPRPTPITLRSLFIAVTPHVVTAGNELTVSITTTPHANVRIDLRAAAARGKPFHVTLQGTADVRGRFTGRIRVAYHPIRKVVAALTVTAGVRNAMTSRTIPVTITPFKPLSPPCRLPCVVPIGPAPQAVAVDVQTSRIFVVDSATNSVSTFDVVTVYPPHTARVGSGPTALDVDAPTGRVFVANTNGSTMSVLDASSGALLRTIPVEPRPVALAVAARAGRVFVLSGNNRVSVLDASSGALLATHAVGNSSANLFALVVDTATGRVFVDDQTSGAVSVLDARSGGIVHTTLLREIPGAMAADPRSGHVFVLAGNNHVTMLDGTTGRTLRTATVGQTPRAIAVDAGTGRVFVANEGSGTTSVLDARTGRVVGTAPVEAQPGVLAVDTLAGHVFVAGKGGDGVVALDARTGRVRGALRVGGQPVALTVDERRGRLFVLVASAGGATQGTMHVLSSR